MTGLELLDKLKMMTNEQLNRSIIVADYSGVCAQFITLKDVVLEEKVNDPINDPDGVRAEDYIAITAKDCYFLG